MHYPSENEITDPSLNLDPEITAMLKPLVEKAQRRYRRFRLDPGDYLGEQQIPIDHAADVFKALAVHHLRNAESWEAFRSAIGMEGEAAETAFRYAHFLYKDVQRGRMLAIWHWNIRDRLWELIRQAEDLWWHRDMVPEGWEEFLGAQHATRGVPHDQTIEAAVQNRGFVPATPHVPRNSVTISNRARVEAFIQQCRAEAGVVVTRTMIWRAVGYQSRSEFERWEANKPNATKRAAQYFEGVLSTPPSAFVDLLRRKKLL